MNHVIEPIQVNVNHVLPVLFFERRESVVARDTRVQKNAPVGAMRFNIGFNGTVRAASVRSHIKKARSQASTEFSTEAHGFVHRFRRVTAI